MTKRRSSRLVAGTLLTDAAMIVLSFLVAYLIRFSGFLPAEHGTPDLANYLNVLIVIVPVFLWFFREARLYEPTRHVRRIEEIFLVLKSVTYAVVLFMAATFFYRQYSYSRGFLIVLWAVSGFFVSAGRYALIQWEYMRRLQKKDATEVLIIGSNQNAHQLIRWCKNNPHYGQSVIGVLTDDRAHIGKHLDDIPILGLAADWEKFIHDLQPDQVVLLDPGFSREAVTDLVVCCEDRMIEFKMGADTHGLIAQNVGIEYISNIPLLGFRALPLDDPLNRFAKKCFDLLLAGIMALAFTPLGLVIALLIKLADGGPVFYYQERVGRDGKVFRLMKFRTMRSDAENQSGPVWAKKDDPRTTWLGRFLRRWNLDEFPQLLNVLKGEMSLVGPRPERPHFVSQFRESVPRYMARHKVKAGVTGWAQVHGLRGDTSIQERVKYDLYYMENWSLLLDIEIVVMTLFAFKNAY